MTPRKGAGKGKLWENTQKVLTGHGKGVNETVKNDLRFLTQATAKETRMGQVSVKKVCQSVCTKRH